LKAYNGVKIIIENVFVEKVNIQIITLKNCWIGALKLPFVMLKTRIEI